MEFGRARPAGAAAAAASDGAAQGREALPRQRWMECCLVQYNTTGLDMDVTMLH